MKTLEFKKINQMCEIKENIRFCAIAQKSGALVIASYLHARTPEVDYMDSCKKMIGSSKVLDQPSSVIINAAENCSCLIQLDQSNIYAIFVDKNYPHKIGFQLLGKIRSLFMQESITASSVENALSKKVKPWMKKLCVEYDDIAAKDKVYMCQQEVDEVKQIMHENIHKILENSEKLEALEINAANLKNTAGVFVKNTKALSDKLWWQNARLRVAIATVGTTVGLGIGATVLPV
jgi:hypothetical protein